MDFLHPMIGRGAIVALLCLVLSGCGPDPLAPADPSMLTIARVKDAVGLDPSHETDGLSLNITSVIMDGLVTFKPGTFDVVPAVAQSWSSSPDGLSWTFYLVPHLRFSDGTALDARAVKFNFDRWRLKDDPYHGNYSYGYYLSQFGGYPGIIKNVTVVDARTVRFTLDKPQGPFLRNLAMPSFAIGSPAAIRSDPVAYSLAPVGSGPYMVHEWEKDDHLTLVANPGWRGHKLAFPRVIVRDIPDQSTSVLSMDKGDVDGLTDLRPDDAKRFSKHPRITVYEQPPNNVAYIALNVERKPFDDVRVRRAVAYAIDARALVKALYAPGAVVADNFTPPGMLGENRSIKAYPHDIAKAKALLAAAGYPKGFSTQFYYGTAPRPYMPEPQRIAETVQSDLAKAGISVTLQPYEWGVYLQKIRNGEHPMCLIGWTGDNGDPDNFMYALLDKDSAVKGSAQNYSFWRDEAFHKLMLEGQSSVDEKRRQLVYSQANAMIHDRVPLVAFVHTAVPFAMSKMVGGVVPRPDSILDFDLMYAKGEAK